MKPNFGHVIIDLNEEKRSHKFWGIKELPELSLTSTGSGCMIDKSACSSSSESSEAGSSRKRKYLSDHLLETKQPVIQTRVDLQISNRLPMYWEQCLDLQSGKMYFLNRKTARKSWYLPKDDKKPDLELNISSTLSDISSLPLNTSENLAAIHHRTGEQEHSSSSSSSNMVAMACLNCHLLVILSKSSPSCPNCKYVHSLLPTQQTPSTNTPALKPLDTLRLFS